MFGKWELTVEDFGWWDQGTKLAGVAVDGGSKGTGVVEGAIADGASGSLALQVWEEGKCRRHWTINGISIH